VKKLLGQDNFPGSHENSAFRNAVNLAKLAVKRAVIAGDTVVDATCGNGHDTLFLAQLDGIEEILAFDIADRAIENTARLLEENSLSERVTLYQENFKLIPEYIKKPAGAVMFNLGYLPGAGLETATRAEDSSLAIKSVLPLLRVGGVLTAVCYPGHPGGSEEARQVAGVMNSLDQKEFEVVEMKFVNQINNPPVLMVVHKLKGG